MLRAKNDGKVRKSIFWSPKWGFEISGFCQFLAKFLTSNGSRKCLTEQPFTERSMFLLSLRKCGNLKKWMCFCVLKALNSFFQLSWKEKTCLLSAVNIEHENFDKKIHIGWSIAFFKDFLAPLRISLRKGEKRQKTACTYKEEFIFRNFHTWCSPHIKDVFCLFKKVEKMNLKPLKRKNPFTFLIFEGYYAQ